MVGIVFLLSSVQLITTGGLADTIACPYYHGDTSPSYIIRQIFDGN